MVVKKRLIVDVNRCKQCKYENNESVAFANVLSGTKCIQHLLNTTHLIGNTHQAAFNIWVVLYRIHVNVKA